MMSLEEFFSYFEYPFVRNAFIVGTLIALCAALLGVTLVLKRLSFIGDGLSHVAFGAMSMVAVAGLTNNMLFIIPITILAAIMLLSPGEKRKIKGDASIAMISVSALAIGYFLMNVFPVSSNISSDVCTTLFGSASILSLTTFKVWLSIGLSFVVLFVFVFFYNKIFSVTFDEPFTKATGTNTKAYNLLLAVIIALVIVLAMNLVGSLLISALIIFPSISAMRLYKTFKQVIITSAIISILSALFGMSLSIIFGTPVGPTIVILELIIFGFFTLLGSIIKVK